MVIISEIAKEAQVARLCNGSRVFRSLCPSCTQQSKNVLVDSVCCCAEIIRAAHQRGFTVVGLLKKNRLLSDGQRAWNVEEEMIVFLQGLEIPVVVVHRGRRKERRTVICTELARGRGQILRHLKQRWGVKVMFKLLKEHFGLGDCRCRGERRLARWGEVWQEWGWTLIQTATEVRD